MSVSRPGRNWLILGLLWTAIYGVAFGGWLLIKPASGFTLTAGDDLLALIGPLILLPLCFAGAGPWLKSLISAPHAAGKAEDWLPVLLGLSVAGFVVARGAAIYYDLILRQPAPFPSAVDVGSLVAYPCLLAAILILPGKAFSAASRTRILLDTSLVLSGLTAFTWYFVLGPLVVQQQGTVLSRAVTGAYPLFDIGLACCLLLLTALSPDMTFRRLIPVVGAALAVLVAADSIREYQLLHGAAASGTLLDLGRPVAFMLICLVAWGARLIDTGSAAAAKPEHPQLQLRGLKRVPQAWRYMLPYCAVPAVVALMIYAARHPEHAHVALGVYIAGALLIELVLLHQFLDYRELIAFASRNARLESLAAADPVTALPNHRTIVASLDREFARSRRYQHPCAVLFMDLDHFKALNDSYGHPAGDAALREFGSVVRSALRSADILGRWGGEEFVAVLPETNGDAACAVAERVRGAVAAHTFWAAGGAHLTCSIGVAAYPEDAATRDILIEKADGAMYVAKRLGRNQVRSATDPAVAALGAEAGPAGVHEEATLAGVVEALVAVAEAHDHCSGQHVQEVASLAARLALELGLDTSHAHLVGLAGRLHDIGKVVVPDVILSKAGPLTEEEWTMVRSHSAMGAAVVSRIPTLSALAPIIRAHHEWWNGEGYPDRLAADSIPLEARIVAVADAYGAMVSDRPHRPARSAPQALDELERWAGTQFDPAVVQALRQVLSLSLVDIAV
jgi:two-component system cell cycle response regulator